MAIGPRTQPIAFGTTTNHHRLEKNTSDEPRSRRTLPCTGDRREPTVLAPGHGAYLGSGTSTAS